jgi:hypothetical protein
MHIRREIGRFVGTQAIKYMTSHGDQGRRVGRVSDLTYCPIRFLPQQEITAHGKSHRIQRDTRLVSAELLRIPPGGRFCVPESSRSEIVGMTYNAARSIGTLRDATTGQLLHRIKPSSLYAKSRGLTLVALPMTQPLKLGTVPAVITYDFHGETTPTQPEPALEIFGFVLRETEITRPVHVATCADGQVALEDLVSASETEDLIRTLLAAPAA